MGNYDIVLHAVRNTRHLRMAGNTKSEIIGVHCWMNNLCDDADIRKQEIQRQCFLDKPFQWFSLFPESKKGVPKDFSWM